MKMVLKSKKNSFVLMRKQSNIQYQFPLSVALKTQLAKITIYSYMKIDFIIQKEKFTNTQIHSTKMTLFVNTADRTLISNLKVDNLLNTCFVSQNTSATRRKT